MQQDRVRCGAVVKLSADFVCTSRVEQVADLRGVALSVQPAVVYVVWFEGR